MYNSLTKTGEFNLALFIEDWTEIINVWLTR